MVEEDVSLFCTKKRHGFLTLWNALFHSLGIHEVHRVHKLQVSQAEICVLLYVIWDAGDLLT